jgi:hypothetical protein
MFNRFVQSARQKLAAYKLNHSLLGRWKLAEYYTESGKNLFHYKENQIVSENHVWELTFQEEDQYSTSSNLEIPLVQDLQSGRWSKSRNFVTLMHSDDFREQVEFQYAMDKGILKLLKKDPFGKIIVFAFFRRIESPIRT